MTVPLVLLAVYLFLGLLYWVWNAYGVVRLTRMRSLSKTNVSDPEAWPSLSVIVPACNEADKIEPAARTLLAQDYPDLEIIFVDDRSTDGTGEIVDRLAAGDSRTKALHIQELPEDWLGKVHALDRGLAESTGEIVLFTDADVHFSPGVLRRAVAYLQHERLDHLALLPRLWKTHLALDSTIAVVIRMVMVMIRPWRVRAPRSKRFFGVGAFNMVRRSAFERTEGFEWLRMEVADDAGVGLMMKRIGASSEIVIGFEELALHWHRTIGEAMRGAEKGAGTALGFSLVRTILAPLAILLLEWAPFLLPICLAFPAVRPVGWVGLGVFALWLFSMVRLGRWSPGGILVALASPLGALLSAVGMFRSGWLAMRHDGVRWRQTRYSRDAISLGSRVKLP